MTPEEKARVEIDRLLELAGWSVQDLDDYNPNQSLGIAVREFPIKGAGEADYILFIDRKAVGVIEAKPAGTTLGGVDYQSEEYAKGFPDTYLHVHLPLPFIYESTGAETFFRDLRDPEPRSRHIFSFHRPDTLKEWINQGETLRCRLQHLPLLISTGLRDCQNEAITNLEDSFSHARPRALIQMATGSGKTYTAVSFIYRLISAGKAKRVLFLVDRNNLARQTRMEFEQYTTPDDGRKFTEIYNVQHLTSNTIDKDSKVIITTIQRLYSMLKGDAEFDSGNEEESFFDQAPSDTTVKEVSYNRSIPIETFDFVVCDECHRSIYKLWRQVLEYYDAFLIGLTATPSKQTCGFFNQNLVMEYSHERAVADGVNVGYDVYRIRTEITENGSTVKAGNQIGFREKQTRKKRWEIVETDISYTPQELDKSVVAEDQIRTIISAYKDLLPEIFPGREWVPKTLIFAKDDSHAENITHIAREVFDKGNDFCKKITYRSTGEKPEVLLQSFRTSPSLRIAVSVDMISTGTDIRALEVLLFMRDVKSRSYYEQMIGRGSRVISSTELESVTKGAKAKTHYVVIDAVGVSESCKIDSQPLERKNGVLFDKLIKNIAFGARDPDSLNSLAGRLSRLDRQIEEKDRKEIARVSGGKSLRQLVNILLDSVDPDVQIKKAKAAFGTDDPSPEQIKAATKELVKEACAPFENPDIRNTIITIQKFHEQMIDPVSIDKVIAVTLDRSQAENVVKTFKQFIDEHKDEISALQIIYSKTYKNRHLTYAQIKELAEAITRPPYHLNTGLVWQAYEELEKSHVKGAGPQKLLTNIISLVRFTVKQSPDLVPFPMTVQESYKHWIENQVSQGKRYTPEQMKWLEAIRDQIATSAEIEVEDFDRTPFEQWGGRFKAHSLFGDTLPSLLSEMNEVLIY